MIDGGKGQLNIIKKLYISEPKLAEILDKIDIISLGKGKARNKNKISIRRDVDLSRLSKEQEIMEKIYHFDTKMNIESQDLTYDEADKLLLMARDEAHRFANAYRKKQMSKEFLNNP